MLESKLEYTVNKLLNSKDEERNKIYLDEVGKLLLKLPYFKMLMEEYSDQDLGPIMFSNLLNHLIIQKYEPNSMIWEYNDAVTGVYIIITGEIKIFKPPNKENLIRMKKIIRKQDALFDEKTSNKKTLKGKYKKATKRNIVLKKLDSFSKLKNMKNNLYRNSIYKMNLVKRKQNTRVKKSASCICLSSNIKLEFNLNVINHNINQNQNIEYKEFGNDICLTEKNYIYRQNINSREIDYIETLGKIIGEDCLIQNLNLRPYGAESMTKSILGFLTSHDYHILFDKINAIKRSNIISFLYNLNYFNNKNNFVHKLYRGIKNILYSKGEYIYKQNSPFRSMFIIKKGNVDMNITKIIKIENEINSEIILGKKFKKIKDKSEIEHFTNERIFELKGEYYEKKVFTIVNCGVGEIIGNLEFFGKIKKYLCSAICISNVELYEIDMNLYKRIESHENIEFLNKKTQKQLEFIKKRINNINNLLKQNKKNYIGFNKFMKAYCSNNPVIILKEKEKIFINDSKNPFPIKIKFRNKKKMKRTVISPFSSFDIVSCCSEDNNNLDINSDDNNINNEKKESPNPFITNNKEFTNNFNDNIKINSNNIKNKNIEKNNEETLSLLNSPIKSSKNIIFKTRNPKKYRTLSVLNAQISKKEKEKEKEKKPKKKKVEFDFSKIFASNHFSQFLSYYSSSISPINRPTDKKNTILNKKFKFNFHLSPRTDRKTITTKINFINKNNMIKGNLKDKNIKSKVGTPLAIQGYRVFIPSRFRNFRSNKRLKSYKIKNLEEDENKGTLKNENENEKEYINIKNNNNKFIRNQNYKRKTDINNERVKSLKIKSFLE